MDKNPFASREKSTFGTFKEASAQELARVRRLASKSTLPPVWRENPEVIYQFLARRPDYEQLCQEIAYVLKRRLEDEGIEYSSISCRAKDLDSYLEKLERKKYANPLSEITDFAGVRVVCLYPSDLEKIETIIHREFEMAEKQNKHRDQSEYFGYNAVHYLVKLGSEYYGARYDHLKNLICEIQTRTVLQHAWALIDQHLVYKKTSQIPEHLRHQIIELSRVLEEADSRFEFIRQQREEYIRSLEKSKSEHEFLYRDINMDSFRIFCKMSFPEAVREKNKHLFTRVLKWIDSDRYHCLGDLHNVVQFARPRLPEVAEYMESIMAQRGRKYFYLSDLDYVHISLAIADPQYRSVAGIPPELYNILEYIGEEMEDEAEYIPQWPVTGMKPDGDFPLTF